MALRETPDLKVGGSIPFGLTCFFFFRSEHKLFSVSKSSSDNSCVELGRQRRDRSWIVSIKQRGLARGFHTERSRTYGTRARQSRE